MLLFRCQHCYGRIIVEFSYIVIAFISVTLLLLTNYSSTYFVNFGTKIYQAATKMPRQPPVAAWLELTNGRGCKSQCVHSYKDVYMLLIKR